MRWSIRLQLLIPLLTLLGGVVGISVWTALASADRARRQIEEQMHDIAHTVASVSFEHNRKILQSMKGVSGKKADYLRCDAHGHPEKEDGRHWKTTLPALPDDPLPAPAPPDQPLTQLPRVKVAGQTYFTVGVPLGEPEHPSGILYIFYPESQWRDAWWDAVRPSLYVGVIGGLASLVLTVVVAQRVSRRVRELERRTGQIAAGDFSPMPLPRRNDELRDLARSVNEMAQQLAQYQETVKKTERLRLLGQVSGGLAHQLRNGVTGAQLAVQLHARTCNGQADAEALDVALRQLTLIEGHLKRFLDLGRAVELRGESVDLIGLIEETVALLQPQCRHAHIDLRWQPPMHGESEPAPELIGDHGQLSQLFLNVITNAMEAAGPGGTVEVQVRIAECGLRKVDLGSCHSAIRNPHSAIVEVRDSGPGPSPEVAARLFEPFVTGKSEGVGLGLAVARQVAEGHGGAIRWRREQEKTVFEIELPLTVGGLASGVPSESNPCRG